MTFEEARRNEGKSGGKGQKKFSSYIFKNRVTLFLSCWNFMRECTAGAYCSKSKHEMEIWKGSAVRSNIVPFPVNIFFAELPAFFNIGGGRKVCEQFFLTWMDSLEFFFLNTGMGTFVFAGDWRIKEECFGPTYGKWSSFLVCSSSCFLCRVRNACNLNS